jgi:hypothetical protein
MKALKTLLLFTFSIVVTSCFDSPEFGDIPRIEYKDIYYGVSTDPDKADSLVVMLEFEDNNGDLGLGDAYRNEPFHEFDFHLTDGTSITSKVRVHYDDPNSIGFLDIPEGVTGKLVRQGESIPGLPEPNCFDYKRVGVNIRYEDRHIFDANYSEPDTFPDYKNPVFFRLTEFFYVDPNENHTNITVRFFQNPNPQDPNSQFVESISCDSFDGRFEKLSDKGSPLSGTMTYTMSSLDFSRLNEGAWQLKITIKDRALHTSNEVSTRKFTLAEIKK